MRKLLFIAIFVVIAINVHAQTVMGMNIRTTNVKLMAQLAKKGYRPFEKKKGEFVYKVTFAEYKDCVYTVKFNTLKNDSVLSVSIQFPHKSPDNDNYGIEWGLQKQLEEKYGNAIHKKAWWDGISLHEPQSGMREMTFANAEYISLKRYWDLDKNGREISAKDNYVVLVYRTPVTPHIDTKPNSDL